MSNTNPRHCIRPGFARWLLGQVAQPQTLAVVYGRYGLRGLALEWTLADAWVGVYWRTGGGRFDRRIDVWVCVVPCLPVHVWWERGS